MLPMLRSHILASNNNEPLVFVDDVSFQNIHAADVSFAHIGASNNNEPLVFVDDVSFQGNIHAADASFAHIGAITMNHRCL